MHKAEGELALLAECFKGIGSSPYLANILPISKFHPVALLHLMACDGPYTFCFLSFSFARRFSGMLETTKPRLGQITCWGKETVKQEVCQALENS